MESSGEGTRRYVPGASPAEKATNLRDAREAQEEHLKNGLLEWDAELKDEKIVELNNQATTDPLTGLENLRSFQEDLEEKLRLVRESKDLPEEHRKESHNVLTLIALDIDHFKNVNDTFGHDAGDEVLRRIAALLRRSVRKSDSVARVGGEEFIIIMPNANADNAARQAEELRNEIKSLVFEFNPDFRITSSFGLASSDMTTDPKSLRKYADEALYEAKERRDQVVVHKGNENKI